MSRTEVGPVGRGGRGNRGNRGNRGDRGFTLIEVMIVAAVLAILTMVALPSYIDSVNRSHRGDARSVMLAAAHFMERIRNERNSYRPDGVVPTLPADLSRSPRTGAARYTIAVAAVDGASYVVTATPTGSMAGDACGNLTLDQTGLRAFSGSGGTFALCWER